MIFKEIDNMKDVWDICHYFIFLLDAQLNLMR
jgi:hypothetical protein